MDAEEFDEVDSLYTFTVEVQRGGSRCVPPEVQDEFLGLDVQCQVVCWDLASFPSVTSPTTIVSSASLTRMFSGWMELQSDV